MTDSLFETSEGLPVPAVTAGQMQEVDRIAVEEFGLSILQMMENAGRNLALNVIDVVGSEGTSPGRGLPSGGRPHKRGEVAILAGPGGNGGGGLCCARHLRNRGFQVSILLSKTPAELRGASAHQLRVLRAAGVEPADQARTDDVLRRSTLVVDALIGYSLRGAPRGRVAELIDGLQHLRAPRALVRPPLGPERHDRGNSGRRGETRAHSDPGLAQDRAARYRGRALSGRHRHPTPGVPIYELGL